MKGGSVRIEDYLAYEYDVDPSPAVSPWWSVLALILVLAGAALVQGAEPFNVTIATEPAFDPLSATVTVAVIDGESTYYGSGTVIDSTETKATVLTCWHTHRGVSPNAVTRVTHAGRTYSANVLRASRENDVTLLEIGTSHALPAVALADVVPSIGDSLISCGRDESGKLTAESTRLTAVDRYDSPLNLETDQWPPLGRSGGGVFDTTGRLVGVLQGRRTDARVALYVRLPAVHELLGRTEAVTEKPRRRRVLAFTAAWCAPCNADRSFKNEAAPWLQKSGWQIDETSRAHVQIVDLDKRPDLAKRYGVETVPALVLIDDDQAIARDTYRGKNTVVDLFANADKPPAAKPIPATVAPTVIYQQPVRSFNLFPKRGR